MDLRELHKAVNAKYMESLRTQALSRTGFDPSLIKWHDNDFSIKDLRETLRKQEASLKEGNADSTFANLFVYGINDYSLMGYDTAVNVYPDLFKTVPSKGYMNLYAPLYDVEMPEEILSGGKFPDSKLEGIDTQIENKEYGRILGIRRTLLDWDQTGQIAERAQRFGGRMAEREETLCMAVIEAIAFSTALAGGGKNRVTSYGAITQDLVEELHVALCAMKDPLGNSFGQRPDTLWCGTSVTFDAQRLMNSAYYPSVPVASAGAVGYTMATNVLQGKYNIKESLKLGENNWGLCKARTGLVFQDELPLELKQENPDSGESFSKNEYRFRSYRRCNAGSIEDRCTGAGRIV